ncbi:MAG: hypothetical protein J0M18_09095 [Ignavibacteria bacterium]|nr:hypothetical protein [Ignavibacteria bacterium]
MYIIFLFVIPSLLYCQQFSEPSIDLIFTDNTPDSIFIKLSSSDKGFDKNGNYFFQVGDWEKKFIHTKDTIVGPLKGGGATNLEFVRYQLDSINVLFRNRSGKNIYGPFRTDKEHNTEYILSKNTDTMAMVVENNNQSYFYINNELKFTTPIDGVFWFNKKEWVAFSGKGDILHVEYKNGVYSLFKNNSVITSSNDKLSHLSININGSYIYTQQKEYLDSGRTYLNTIMKYDGKEFIVNGGCWHYTISDNGSFIFEGFRNNKSFEYFKFINGYYRDGFKESGNVNVEKDSNFFYTCEINDKKYFVHGASLYEDNFDIVYLPSIDSLGNFALFGLKDYYIYRFINGVRDEQPISKYGVRPEPIYISPLGDAVYCYKVKDSVFVFKNNDKIFSSGRNKFIYEDLFKSYSTPLQYKKKNNYRFLSLQYLQIEDEGYVLYNGKLSERMLPFKEKISYDFYTPGEVILGGIYENKFSIVQYHGNGNFLININNSTYAYINNFDELFTHENEFFDGKELTFFGRSGRDFKKVNLIDE